MDAHNLSHELDTVLFTEPQIRTRVAELARAIEGDVHEHPPLIIGVLKGSVMFVADLCRELDFHAEMDWIALSSYGSSTKSSGEVRIVTDLVSEVRDRDLLVVEDIIDTGLTLQWLVANLLERGARSVRVCALLRKPDAAKVNVDVHYVGFDIPNEFVVGYGLDYDQKYRNLREIAVLSPEMYR
jgi:hypoxanthine phosphoribosyltransferase